MEFHGIPSTKHGIIPTFIFIPCGIPDFRGALYFMVFRFYFKIKYDEKSYFGFLDNFIYLFKKKLFRRK
jgi:hypothetical protein